MQPNLKKQIKTAVKLSNNHQKQKQILKCKS